MTIKPAREPITPAERMRTHRERRRNGFQSIPELLHDTDIDGLVTRGYLKPNRRHDPKAIQDALVGFICHTLSQSE